MFKPLNKQKTYCKTPVPLKLRLYGDIQIVTNTFIIFYTPGSKDPWG